MKGLDEARQWAPFATETDFVMDLKNMNLVFTSISPYLHWDCKQIPTQRPLEKGMRIIAVSSFQQTKFSFRHSKFFLLSFLTYFASLSRSKLF